MLFLLALTKVVVYETVFLTPFGLLTSKGGNIVIINYLTTLYIEDGTSREDRTKLTAFIHNICKNFMFKHKKKQQQYLNSHCSHESIEKWGI